MANSYISVNSANAIWTSDDLMLTESLQINEELYISE